MIDKRYQHKGYGTKALEMALKMIKNDAWKLGVSEYIWLSYEKENIIARNFYLHHGFIETEMMCGNEVIAIYRL